MAPVVVNAATNMKYPFSQGSVEERALFRVMSTEAQSGSHKMYFDSKEQYMSWRKSKIETDKAIAGLNIHVVPGIAASTSI
jgi:hypothetical protein